MGACFFSRFFVLGGGGWGHTHAGRLWEIHEATLVELGSGSRRNEVVEARRVFAPLGMMGLSHSGSEVARLLGITTSCIDTTAAIGEMPTLSDYMKR